MITYPSIYEGNKTIRRRKTLLLNGLFETCVIVERKTLTDFRISEYKIRTKSYRQFEKNIKILQYTV